MKPNKVKGIICGIVAAITYGMNPLGALNLYAEGINPNSVLFYRYFLAVVILAVIMLVRRESFRVTKKELGVTAFLGLLFAISSLTLFFSFKYMDAGIACTILFSYPVMVAVIMAIFFKEKINFITIFSIALALAGIGMLYRGGDGGVLSTVGVLLVLASSLTYAVYIVTVNRWKSTLSPVKLTFYVMLFGTVVLTTYSFFSEANHIQPLTTPAMWGWAVMLAVFPTVVSLILMTVAVKEIGSTPTAIMGALEPVTAVLIGVLVFHETFTLRFALGITMILVAVMMIIAGKSIKPGKSR